MSTVITGVPSLERSALPRWGARSAFTVLALMPVQMLVYALWPPPMTVLDWFALFNRSPLIGLISMDVLLTVDYVLLALFFLALWVSLHPASPAWAATGLLCELVGVSVYFASGGAVEMLALSSEYADAGMAERRMVLLAAGESILVTWQGTAFVASYVLGALATLAMSAAMHYPSRFSRAAAPTGMIAGLLNLVPPVFGPWSVWLSVLSLLPTALWLFLAAQGLRRRLPDPWHVQRSTT
jgi:hypothetical protein